jgi:hypothetical protein
LQVVPVVEAVMVATKPSRLVWEASAESSVIGSK